MYHAATVSCSLLLAICRWCNLSQLLHTAEQQGAPRSATAFRELFQQAWCHAAVFLLANYTAVLVALLRQEVEQQQQQQQQLLPPAAARSPLQQQPAGRASPVQQRAHGSPLDQTEQQVQTLSLQNHTSQQQEQQQHATAHSAGTTLVNRAAPQSQQQLLQPLQQLLSTAAVWRDMQLPAAHSAWVPPRNPQVWLSQGLGVTHSAAAELQLLLMLWGWAIRRAPGAGLEHHASGDVLLLLLEAAWLLDVCPAAASHQKRGLCLWSTPAHMLRLLAQPVLPPDDDAPSSQAAAAAGRAQQRSQQQGDAAADLQQQQQQEDASASVEQQQQRKELLRLLQHPGLAGCLVQLPLELLKALQPLSDVQLKQAAMQFSRLDDTVRRLLEMPTLLLQMEDGLLARASADAPPPQQQQQQPERAHGETINVTSSLVCFLLQAVLHMRMLSCRCERCSVAMATNQSVAHALGGSERCELITRLQ
jgi:hypothetical protein